MGRLIDADKLIEELKKHYIGVYRLDTLAQRYIDEQPTAYNPEKVVEEIKEYSIRTFGEIRTENVIEIVRKGGVE